MNATALDHELVPAGDPDAHHDPLMRECGSCGADFTQAGPGRPRIVCSSPACEARRKAYRRRGESDLDRPHGDPEEDLHVPSRVFQQALRKSHGREST